LEIGNQLLQPFALGRLCLHIGAHRRYILGNLVLDAALP
jgi:hypothetical protein